MPVAVRSATIGDETRQKDCEDAPVGEGGDVAIVTVTSNLSVLSHPLWV